VFSNSYEPYYSYLERLSERRGLTQRQLSDRTGKGGHVRVSQSAICLIMQGRLKPTDAQLESLAYALNVSPPEILLRPCVVIEPSADKAEAVR
jgi:transcriptional regulator with XRE-family HTH domain